MEQLTTFEDLSYFLPALQEIHGTYKGIWPEDCDKSTFVMNLIDDFNNGAFFFGSMNNDGELIYFASVRTHLQNALFTVFYTNPKFRENTKTTMPGILRFLTNINMRKIACISTNTSPAFKRWIKKFNAVQTAVQYNIKE